MIRIRKDTTSGRFIQHAIPNLCSIKNCEKRVTGRGYCNTHYLRLVRYGDPLFRKKAANGEGGVSANGYRMITVNGKQIPEHRHIMAVHLGRALKPEEIVHHIDGNKINNTITNLSLMNRSAHVAEHPEVLAFLKLGPLAQRRTL